MLQQQVDDVANQIRHVVDELQQARQDMVRAERLAAVGELAAGVAHELRNPLTSVKLLIQTSRQKGDESSQDQKRLSIIQYEISRMETTIQALLDFARPPKLRRVAHDLRDTLKRALNLCKGKAAQQAVEVSEELPDVPVVVDGDPEQLDQVFLNLLLNGIESMESGGELKISMGIEREQGICQVQFVDTGPGIPEPIIDRIFEPFVTGKPRGVGLGLAISNRIIREHSGRLTAANMSQGGAVMTVELPLSSTSPSQLLDLASSDRCQQNESPVNVGNDPC